MIVTVQVARYARQVRHDRGQFAQIDAVQRDRQVLKIVPGSLGLLGVDLYTSLVVGYEVNLGLQTVVLVDEQVVVFVQVELLVADGRTVGHQVDAYALVDH